MERWAAVWLVPFVAATLALSACGTVFGLDGLSQAGPTTDASTNHDGPGGSTDTGTGRDAKEADVTTRGDGSGHPHGDASGSPDGSSEECDATTCPHGCCSAGACVPYASESGSSCGTAGAACVACANQLCDTANGTCACDSTTCPNGCCNGGTAGKCDALTSESASSCGAKGATCTGCAPGQACVSGACTCNPSSCTTGCCAGDACVELASQGPSMCGAGGVACSACSSLSDSCTMGACSCGGTACNGCCNNNTCEPYASETSMSCGAGGAACQACPTGQACTAMPAQTSNGQCCSTVEICNNGIDDNCDGKIDCDDPQCTQAGGPNGTGQWECANLPSGVVNGVTWSIVAFDPTTSNLSCPANYTDGPTDYYGGATFSSYSCDCTCKNTAAAYCKGSWCYTDYNNTGNNKTCPSPGYTNCLGFNTQANGTQYCGGLSPAQDIPADWYFVGKAENLVTQPGVCSGSSAPTTKPAPTYTKGEGCSLTQAGSGCTGSGVCVPVNAPSFSTCSIAQGAVACPTGLNAYKVYASAPTETYTCSSCTCDGNSDLQCDAIATAYMQDSNCNGATGYCDPAAGSTPDPFAYASNTCQYSAGFGCSGTACMHSYCVAVKTVGSAGSCTANNTPSPTGAVMPEGQESTVCCPP